MHPFCSLKIWEDLSMGIFNQAIIALDMRYMYKVHNINWPPYNHLIFNKHEWINYYSMCAC